MRRRDATSRARWSWPAWHNRSRNLQLFAGRAEQTREKRRRRTARWRRKALRQTRDSKVQNFPLRAPRTGICSTDTSVRLSSDRYRTFELLIQTQGAEFCRRGLLFLFQQKDGFFANERL